jgi:hypothetical protein
MLSLSLYLFVLSVLARTKADIRVTVLQGFMYLTNSYLCFFAHIPTKEVRYASNSISTPLTHRIQDHILKSGFMTKKTTRTRRWIKHWFILKNDTLSWYQSSAVSVLTYQSHPYLRLCRTLTSRTAS